MKNQLYQEKESVWRFLNQAHQSDTDSKANLRKPCSNKLAYIRSNCIQWNLS